MKVKIEKKAKKGKFILKTLNNALFIGIIEALKSAVRLTTFTSGIDKCVANTPPHSNHSPRHRTLRARQVSPIKFNHRWCWWTPQLRTHTEEKKTNKQKTFSCIKLKFHNRAIARSFRYAWLDEKCRQMTEQNTMNRHNIHCDKRSFATNGDVPSAEWERERGWTLLVTR